MDTSTHNLSSLFQQLGLTADEAYYWRWAERLDWGYYDHPPGVAGVTSPDGESFIAWLGGTAAASAALVAAAVTTAALLTFPSGARDGRGDREHVRRLPRRPRAGHTLGRQFGEGLDLSKRRVEPTLFAHHRQPARHDRPKLHTMGRIPQWSVHRPVTAVGQIDPHR